MGRQNGIAPEKIEALGNYRSSPLFSSTERLVLEFADAITQTPVEVNDSLFARLLESFTSPQLVELTANLAWENYRARYNHARDRIGELYRRQRLCAARDVGKTLNRRVRRENPQRTQTPDFLRALCGLSQRSLRSKILPFTLEKLPNAA